MPGFTPGRRWQPAYYPFENKPLYERALESLERSIKGALFGCRMCGNCMLQETAFICPMECPKGLRNGPCGGSTPEHCYVDESRPCIWYEIYARAEKLGRLDLLLEVLPPLEWEKVGGSAWTDALKYLQQAGGIHFIGDFLTSQKRDQLWNDFCYNVRQPDWWQGDSLPHPAPEHEPVSNLERKFKSGEFVITSEVAPPLSANPEAVIKKINILRDYIDAVNFTDNPSAVPRMSSLACSLLALQNGLEPVMQMNARDRNRMGVQAEILGAAAMGIRNILCISGDHPQMGPSPAGRQDVWDIDSIQMIWILRRMRDEGHFLDGRPLKSELPIFIGAAASPFASAARFQAIRERKKANAGAQFFQTNIIADVDEFEKYLELLDKQGVLQDAHLLASIMPMKSARAASILNGIPGVNIPKRYIERMENAADAKEEGVQIALELIDRLKKLPGIHGIHIMTVSWESIVPRLISESGLRSPQP